MFFDLEGICPPQIVRNPQKSTFCLQKARGIIHKLNVLGEVGGVWGTLLRNLEDHAMGEAMLNE